MPELMQGESQQDNYRSVEEESKEEAKLDVQDKFKSPLVKMEE